MRKAFMVVGALVESESQSNGSSTGAGSAFYAGLWKGE
jgi:hypothetical protein